MAKKRRRSARSICCDERFIFFFFLLCYIRNEHVFHAYALTHGLNRIGIPFIYWTLKQRGEMGDSSIILSPYCVISKAKNSILTKSSIANPSIRSRCFGSIAGPATVDRMRTPRITHILCSTRAHAHNSRARPFCQSVPYRPHSFISSNTINSTLTRSHQSLPQRAQFTIKIP